jgi:hypothetical protein
MPLTIVTQPAPISDLLTPYAPVRYILTATTAFVNPPIVAATVFINGVQAGEQYTQAHYQNILGTYYFAFDIAERLRDRLNNTDTFLSGANTNTAPAADAANVGFARQCAFYVDFELYEASGVDGILEPSGVTDTSNPLYALNIAANSELPESTLNAIGSVLPFRFMTNAPKAKAIPLNANEYLSFWDLGAPRRGVRFRSYDSLGAVVATAYLSISQGLNTVNRVRRINVGTTAAAAVLGSLTGISFYTVAVVNDTTALPPLAISEERTFHIDRSPCKSLALHFLNVFGADDTLRLNQYSQQTATEKQNYAQNVDAYPTPTARGLTTLNSIQTKTYELRDTAVPNSLLYWYEEAANAVEAYLEFDVSGIYTAVQIEDADLDGESTDEDGRDIQLTVTIANPKISHTN